MANKKKDLHIVEKENNSIENNRTEGNEEFKTNVQDWVKQYDNCLSEEEKTQMIYSIISNYYLPYGLKLAIIKGMIIGANQEKVNGTESWLVIDSPLRYITYIGAIIMGYTNLNFTEDSLNNYDALQSRGLINKIFDLIGNDISEFTSLYNMVWDDFMVNENNPKVYLMRLIDRIGNIFKEGEWLQVVEEFQKAINSFNTEEQEVFNLEEDDLK